MRQRHCGEFLRRVGLKAIIALALSGSVGAVEPETVQQSRSRLGLAPTSRQLATLPPFEAHWHLSPGVTARFADVLRAAGFSAEVSEALQSHLRLSLATGEGGIIPDEALLDRFSAQDRLRWWSVLARHAGNATYRWPLVIAAPTLARWQNEPEWVEVATLIKRWGVQEGGHVLFCDLFAADTVWANAEQRKRFFLEVLTAGTYSPVIRVPPTTSEEHAAAVAYWSGGRRSVSVESLLNAIGRSGSNPQVDVSHLLPRLARSVLNTFPPNLALAQDPSIDNAALAMSFFDLEPTAPADADSSFAEWLRAHCDPVEGERSLGDVVVFEDLNQSRWPYAAVYVADGLLLGRKPTLHGPWALMRESEVMSLNPRLRVPATRVFRSRPRPSGNGDAAIAPGPAPRLAPSEGPARALPAGPWGRLRMYEISLQPSKEALRRMPVPAAQPRWSFRRTTREQFRRAIGESEDLAPTTRRDLAALVGGGGREPDPLVVLPSHDLVLSTPPSFRERLFPRLVHGFAGTDYAQEIGIPSRVGADDWFPADLPERGRELLLRLAYRRGQGLMLSDFGALYHGLPDADEREATLAALFRTPALILLLERPAGDEVDAVASYWRLDQQKSLKYLLQSFSGNGQAPYLDVVHLLPPLARELLNVYAAAPADAPTPSCYWTALNFAADRPDSRLLVVPRAPGREAEVAWEKLQTAYERVPKPELLGDVIVYRNISDGELRHLCSFVAAEVVYTKNGLGPMQPWCLMRLTDVDALYLESEDVERLTFRLREE
jgi:hypothetical protein